MTVCEVSRSSRACALVSLLWASQLAMGQTPPDAGRILQDTRLPAAQSEPLAVPPIEASAAPHAKPAASPNDATVQVSQFTFSGNAALSSETLSLALAPWVGRPLNFGQLIEAVEAVEARYKKSGFFLAQANLPPQKIHDGEIEISISEGRLGETRLEGESLIAANVVYDYLDRLPKQQALVLAMVERQVLLINELAGSKVNLDLQAGDLPGTTDVVLTQVADQPLNGKLEINNYGAPSTGQNRVGLTLLGNSLFQQGERITFNTMTSDTSGLLSYTLRGELPVGGDGWRVSATASRASYSLGGDFAALDASGVADSLRAGVAYPLLLSRSKNLRFQLDADQSHLVDNFRASATYLDKQSAGLSLSANADWTDQAGGSNRMDLVLRSARLALGAAAAQQDTYATEGDFGKLVFNATRQQSLMARLSLQLGLSWQEASKNLDSSEKFSLGGPQTMPGYGNGDGIGDAGYQLKLQLRYEALPGLALSLFSNYANLKLHEAALASDASNERILSDYGLGADWALGKHVSASALMGWPSKVASNPADNDKPRFWLTAAYAW